MRENSERFVPVEVELRFGCIKCGHKWSAPAINDYGMTDLIDEEDSKCPKCGEWNE